MNHLRGGDGADYIYGDGESFDGLAGFGAFDGKHEAGSGAAAPDKGDDDDILQGEAGNDTLFGGFGSDILDGGADTDIADYSGVAAYLDVTTLDAEAGNYQVEKWYPGTGSIPLTDPADDIDMLYSIENFVANTSDDPGTGFRMDGYGGENIMGDETDTTPLGASPHATGGSSVFGLGGNDILYGHNGHNDLLVGGKGEDDLRGWGGNDKLLGGADDDYLTGAAGDDYLDGGTGNDEVHGGKGNDLYVHSGGADIFSEEGDSDDVDTLRFQSGVALSDLTFARHGNSSDVEISISGGDTVTLETQNDGSGINILQLSGGDIDISTIQVPVYGTSADDSIYGTYSYLSGGTTHLWQMASIDDLIYGHGGNDSIDARHGNNTVYGGAGDDLISCGNDSDLFYGDADNDRLNGAAGNDFLYGGSGEDTVRGGHGADGIFGGAGNDTLYGDNDNDHLEGGAGDDTIYGGSGVETAVFSGTLASYTITNLGSGGYEVAGTDGNNILYQVELFSFDDYTGGLQIGTESAATIHGSADDDLMYGYGGNDRLFGNAGDDTIYGGDGNDRLEGRQGNDIYHMGLGNDQVKEFHNGDDT